MSQVSNIDTIRTNRNCRHDGDLDLPPSNQGPDWTSLIYLLNHKVIRFLHTGVCWFLGLIQITILQTDPNFHMAVLSLATISPFTALVLLINIACCERRRIFDLHYQHDSNTCWIPGRIIFITLLPKEHKQHQAINAYIGLWLCII